MAERMPTAREVTTPAEDEVCRDVVLPVSPDEAWALVTDPDHLEQWFAPHVDLDLQEGGAALFRWDGGHERRGVVEEVVRSERLVFRWRSHGAPADDPRAAETRVEIELEPVPEGTRLIVRERGFTGVRAAADVAGCVLVTRWAWDLRLAACLGLFMPVTA